MNRGRIGGCLFFLLSLGYGVAATDIPTLPIDEFEAMNARSLPFVLSGAGMILSLIMLVFPAADSEDGGAKDEVGLLDGYWMVVAALIAAVIAYALVLERLGFLLSTALFLAAGFLILGERRWPVVFGLPFALVGTLWLILVPGLDIYLAPGSLLARLFG